MILRSTVWFACLFALVACFCASLLHAQSATPAQTSTTRVVLILPFENAGAGDRLAWLGEGLAELSIQRMSLAGVVTYPRADWLSAIEKLGLPASSRFTRATMLKVARQINADYVMYGRYSADATGLKVTANVLRVTPQPGLSAAMRESGPLNDLMEVHARLAWQALRYIQPDFPLSRQAYAQRLPRLRLDAFESYVRGLLATESAQRINFFREAARLEPDWPEPAFALGREYFGAQNCGTALIWFSKIVPAHPRGPEAAFYAGLCHLRGNDPQRAEAAFAALLQRTAPADASEPRYAGMQDVLNNLAVAESRQGKWREASTHWQRAQQLEPGHAGYWFNFAIGALRAGEWNSAARALRESLRLNAEDAQARALLIAVLERAGRATEAESEREACAAPEGCEPTAAIRAIWKTPQAPASPEALSRLDRLSDSPEFFVRQRESLPAAAPRSSTLRPRSGLTGGRQ